MIKPVPPGATVVGIPGRIAEDHRKPPMDLEHGNLPDPVAEAIRFVLRQQDKLEERLGVLEGASGITSPKDELLEKILIEAVFSQGGGI